VNCKRKSRRRFFLLMRSRTPPISSEISGGWGFEHPKPALSVRHCMYTRTHIRTPPGNDLDRGCCSGTWEAVSPIVASKHINPTTDLPSLAFLWETAVLLMSVLVDTHGRKSQNGRRPLRAEIGICSCGEKGDKAADVLCRLLRFIDFQTKNLYAHWVLRDRTNQQKQQWIFVVKSCAYPHEQDIDDFFARLVIGAILFSFCIIAETRKKWQPMGVCMYVCVSLRYVYTCV